MISWSLSGSPLALSITQFSPAGKMAALRGGEHTSLAYLNMLEGFEFSERGHFSGREETTRS